VTVDANQPSCARCAAGLPSADVEKVVGACGACGAPFDFTARATAPLVVGPPRSDSVVQDTRELPLPPSVPLRPWGVTVKLVESATASGNAYRSNARAQTDLDVSWRAGARALMTFVMMDVVLLGTFIALGRQSNVGAFAAVLLILFVLTMTLPAANYYLRNRIRLIATQATIFVQWRNRSELRTQSLALEDVSRFFCERTKVANPTIERRVVHDVCAMTRDGKRVPLVVDIDREAIALYVATLLQERLAATRPS
jgi:hypothetical protein